MGRIKSSYIKRIALEIYKTHGAENSGFNADFENNKKKLIEYADIPSKKMRNKIAGYITKYIKHKKPL